MDHAGPQTILITGASSGIGAALARAYAGPGITLHLGGRDRARLEATAAACRAAGATVSPRCGDVADAPAMAAWVAEAASERPLDLVIANAGISGEQKTGGGSNVDNGAAEGVRALVGDILRVNVTGVVNTVYPALKAMMRSPGAASGGERQIAIMSSIAGFRGMPAAPAYCASKAAILLLGESLRLVLARHGIGVSVICPGFVTTPMTDGNPFPMPFLMPADRAARIIKRGLARNRQRISFPLPMAAAAWLLGALPPSWSDLLIRQFARSQR